MQHWNFDEKDFLPFPLPIYLDLEEISYFKQERKEAKSFPNRLLIFSYNISAVLFTS